MADIHMFEGEDIVETLAAQAEGHEPGELGALAYPSVRYEPGAH